MTAGMHDGTRHREVDVEAVDPSVAGRPCERPIEDRIMR